MVNDRGHGVALVALGFLATFSGNLCQLDLHRAGRHLDLPRVIRERAT